MCGICGAAGDLRPDHLDAMVAAIRPRGPDGEGIALFPDKQVGLGHARLAILDLSPAGHQPMADAAGQVWIAYNGEVYNHLDLRRELDGKYTFRGHSDTETILYAYLEWGRDCVTRLNGMFAFAIWDGRSGEMWVVRDRFGIKPLYYSLAGGRLRFASEVRAVLADPDVPRDLDLEAVDSFLRLRYVVHPRTLARAVKSLPAGHQLVWRDGQTDISAYWTADWNGRCVYSPDEARERFEQRMRTAVQRTLLSDVPVGVFLSGGLDSTVVTALAQGGRGNPISTFSVGFEGADDDAQAAAEVARLLGCDHHTFTCTTADFAMLPDVVQAADQPVGDSVMLPIFQLAARARPHVKTVLTGEGADEILMGYAHQAQLLKLSRMATILGFPGVAPLLSTAARLLPVRFWDRFFNYGTSLGRAGVDRMLTLVAEIGDASRRYLNYASLFAAADRHALYSGPLAAIAGRLAPAGLDVTVLEGKGGSELRRLQSMEFQAWLPDNILTKQDSLSMANGLETRVPFLDTELVDEVLSWDPTTFRAVATDKDVLRRLLAKLAPELPRRPKSAFRLDVDGAYRQALVKLVHDTVLSPGSLIGPLLNRTRVETLLAELDHSAFVRSKQLAALVILDLWVSRYLRS